ncbi:MFS transporter [Sphaerotilus mobilis]|uniref:Putative MFS family arabinose efflux permease n=1 Tax=Sphaerotilus mobilis TaxID=47994 RepID=A0A4V2EX70_9BURK|nr:MFS transporter [Sphaerotilus mobilis]RZS58460.1 putative MFS family arabinose efflux permease [Sphaerotilus mobilis]
MTFPASMTVPVPARTVVSLGTAQTLAWASTYYLPAILATPIAQELGTSVPTVFAAFSLALILAAAVGPLAGAAIDRLGGRPVLMGTSVVFALGLAALGLAQGPVSLFAAWLLIGLGMGSGLYDAAFAALVRLQGQGARASITGVTLFAGFASTVGWPLSTWLAAEHGWRSACFTWAALHLLIGLPLNALLPKVVPALQPAAVLPAVLPAVLSADDTALDKTQTENQTETQTREPPPSPEASAASWWPMLILSFVFSATWFISTAMASHLPRLMQAAGTTAAGAVWVGSLIGPAQVAGRLLEFGWLRRVHPLLSARLAAAMHPLGVGVLMVGGPVFAPLFGLLHGAGNGVLTIAKGTLPLALFGSGHYGARQGWLMLPARIAQALAPYLFGLVLDHLQANALWVTAAVGLSAWAALLALRAAPPVR